MQNKLNTKLFIGNKKQGYGYRNTNQFLIVFIIIILLIGNSSCTTTKDENQHRTISNITEIAFKRGVNLTNWLPVLTSFPCNFR